MTGLPRRRESGDATVHPTAIIEPGVRIGPRTAVWNEVHIRGETTVGHDCIIGEKTYIAYGVIIGNLVKVNAFVYICTGIVIEDRVMVSAGVVFTNDRFPRAFGVEGLFPSGVTEETLTAVVREGATLGARAVVGPGLEIGRFAMVGMGAVVTRDVPAHALVHGVPARIHGWVCECGRPLMNQPRRSSRVRCGRCDRTFQSQCGPEGEMRIVAESDVPLGTI